jgi:hypothetical protein
MTKRRGGTANPYLYPDIPAITLGYKHCPLKAFVVDLELLPALAPRVFLDRLKPAKGTINGLDGPASTGGFTISQTFPKLRAFLASEETRRRETPIVLDGSGIPSGFTFGLLDIVTYPFVFMLTHSVELDSQMISDGNGWQLWMVNSNLLNHYYPPLRRLASVLTIPHFDEEPIDDAPIHNIVLWRRHREEADTIRRDLRLLTQIGVPTHFVCRDQPIMDDRYALHERRPEDGKPFNLLPLLDIATRGLPFP